MSGGWDGRLVEEPSFGERDLGSALRRFYQWQSERWPRLALAREQLEEVQTREMALAGRKVILQWNPGRTASTTARVDDTSVRERPCFLCEANQPVEESGVAFGDELVFQTNPAPITPLHFTITHRRHTPQALLPVLSEMIAAAVATSGHLTIFYNGPRCGASAPDHLHLQAMETGASPDEREVACRACGCGREPLGRVLVQQAGLHAWLSDEGHRTLLVLRGTPAGVEHGVRETVRTLETLGSDDEEPPLNLLISAEGPLVTALLYPRGSHRPSCYFADGAEQLLVSPGALDMAGLVITVRQQDFQRLDEERMRSIYLETSYDSRRRGDLEALLRERLANG